MSAYYTVVQYVPDPVTDERVNIGVIVFQGTRVRAQFLRRWHRAKLFGGEDIQFLRDFAQEITGSIVQPDLPLNEHSSIVTWQDRLIESMARRWKNSIQLAQPRASLSEPEALLKEMAQRFLREPQPVRLGVRDRRAAAALAFRALSSSLSQREVGDPSELIDRRRVIEGKVDQHEFDVVLHNGSPLLAAQGLSYEIEEAREIKRHVDSIAWALSDVRQRDKKISLAVVELPPKRRREISSRADKVFTKLGAAVVREKDVQEWASRMVIKVAPRH